jgi:hypothetical protein
MAFKPGNNANPDGGKVVKAHKQKLASELLAMSVPKAVKAINAALDSKDPAWAAKLVFEYVYGKPSQAVDLTTQGNKVGILYVGVAPEQE